MATFKEAQAANCFPVQWFMQIFGCLVARPELTAAEIKEIPSGINESMCSVNLDPELIASLAKNALSNENLPAQ